MDEGQQYPIGRLVLPSPDAPPPALLGSYVAALQGAPAELRALTAALSDEALARRYRPQGWTVRQLVHHLADAHEQGFMRFRWGLTEAEPTILPMNEASWARLPDYQLPVAPSLDVFEGVNTRWLALLAAVQPGELSRRIRHPQEGEQDLWRLLAKHAWHVRHHTAHIRLALVGL